MEKHLLVVWHSQTGRTQTLLDAVLRGAATFADEVSVRSLPALQAGLDDLLWADGLLLGTPENFGYMSGALKDFLDRTYYPAQGKMEGRPYAVFVSAGNDGSGAVTAIERIARGYGWQRVADPVVVRGGPTEADLAAAEELGALLAAGLATGIF